VLISVLIAAGAADAAGPSRPFQMGLWSGGGRKICANPPQKSERRQPMVDVPSPEAHARGVQVGAGHGQAMTSVRWPRFPQKAVVAFSAALCVALIAARPACSQWWNPFAPKDYEECAERAARDAKSAQALNILLSSCSTKFVGRRKPGTEGYTYYDSRQLRSFDIEGPNPTDGEWDYINRQYSIYQKEQQRLEEQRRAAQAEAERRRKEQEAADRKAAAEAERQRREQEAAQRAAEAAAAADFERRRENAQTSLTFLLKNIECKYPLLGCGSYRVTITLKNRSSETVTAISLGWAFYPSGGGYCPSSYVTKHTSSVHLLPGETVTLNADGFDGLMEDFGYCIGITGVRILQ
jgi:hypothetical protein